MALLLAVGALIPLPYEAVVAAGAGVLVVAGWLLLRELLEQVAATIPDEPAADRSAADNERWPPILPGGC